tara:strand:- start:30733 stop:31080 length:348 start_codon:yes stop_codon:yes gene_type:complete
MEKFLSIPVLDANGTNSQSQLVSITGISLIGQPTTTSVSIKYLGGKTITLTWPAASAVATPALQVSITKAIESALTSGWTEVSVKHDPKGSSTPPVVYPAVVEVIINPLSAIAIA